MLLPSTARDIFQQFTETLQSPDTSADQCLALFADDAVSNFRGKPRAGSHTGSIFYSPDFVARGTPGTTFFSTGASSSGHSGTASWQKSQYSVWARWGRAWLQISSRLAIRSRCGIAIHRR